MVLVDLGTTDERMFLDVEITDGAAADPALPERVREAFLGKMYRLAHELHDRPDRLEIRPVERLATNARTMKTPMIRRETSR